ncbi:MAG: DUF1761 domain-containing protein [Patescibacteria group bacterium]
MNINYAAVLVASLAQFVFGAVWYTPVFGKVWGKIHGFDKVSKAEQQKMMKQMVPLLGMQFLTTIVTTVVLSAMLTETANAWSAYAFASLCWIGFIVPTQVSAVLFGGTEPKWVVTKILIMAGAAFGCMMIAAAILGAM